FRFNKSPAQIGAGPTIKQRSSAASRDRYISIFIPGHTRTSHASSGRHPPACTIGASRAYYQSFARHTPQFNIGVGLAHGGERSAGAQGERERRALLLIDVQNRVLSRVTAW